MHEICQIIILCYNVQWLIRCFPGEGPSAAPFGFLTMFVVPVVGTLNHR
jgi:hypothetical protein